jgi:hypothetical protein
MFFSVIFYQIRWCTKIFNHPNRVTLSIILNGLKIFHNKYKNQFHTELHRQQISSKKRLEILLACKRVSLEEEKKMKSSK